MVGVAFLIGAFALLLALRQRDQLGSGPESLLDAVVRDVLTNPKLKSVRDFYGTPGDKRYALLVDQTPNAPWSPLHVPKVAGYSGQLITRDDYPRPEGRRLLGIHLADANMSQIHVGIFNAGGDSNGGVIGACSLSYMAAPVGDRWDLELANISDP
jgi:hypothetical protein